MSLRDGIRRARRVRFAGTLVRSAVREAAGDATAATQILKSGITWWLLLELAIKLLPLFLELWTERGEDNFDLAANVAIDKLSKAAAKSPEAVGAMASAAAAGALAEAGVLQWLADRSALLSAANRSDQAPDDGD